ncbi:MAG: YraN family protein [Patescibacteria group bacterium]
MSLESLGKVGEKIALEHYLMNGYKLVAKNFQFYRQGNRGRLGEIDLIMTKKQVLYLIEVKTRSNSKFGSPVEQISKTKLQHLYKTYQYFLLKHKLYQNWLCQFDVASVEGNKVTVFPNAYSFEGLDYTW